jgi:hypothetical protein
MVRISAATPAIKTVVFNGFLQFIEANEGILPISGQGHILPNASQFIITLFNVLLLTQPRNDTARSRGADTAGIPALSAWHPAIASSRPSGVQEYQLTKQHRCIWSVFPRQQATDSQFNTQLGTNRLTDQLRDSGWTAEESGFVSRHGKYIPLFSTASRPAVRSTWPPIYWIAGTLSSGIKRPGHEADHSPPTSAIRNTQIYCVGRM